MLMKVKTIQVRIKASLVFHFSFANLFEFVTLCPVVYFPERKTSWNIHVGWCLMLNCLLTRTFTEWCFSTIIFPSKMSKTQIQIPTLVNYINSNLSSALLSIQLKIKISFKIINYHKSQKPICKIIRKIY